MRAPQITFNSSNILLCLPFSLSSRKSCALDIAFFAAAAPRARSHFYRGKKEKIDARGAFKKQQTSRRDTRPTHELLLVYIY